MKELDIKIQISFFKNLAKNMVNKKVKITKDDISLLYPDLNLCKDKPYYNDLVNIIHLLLYKTFTHPTRKYSSDFSLTQLAKKMGKNRKRVYKYVKILENLNIFFAVESFTTRAGSNMVKKTQIIRSKHSYEGQISDIEVPVLAATPQTPQAPDTPQTPITKLTDMTVNDYKLEEEVIPQILIRYGNGDILKDENALNELIRQINLFEDDPNFKGNWLEDSKYLRIRNEYMKNIKGDFNASNIKT